LDSSLVYGDLYLESSLNFGGIFHLEVPHNSGRSIDGSLHLKIQFITCLHECRSQGCCLTLADWDAVLVMAFIFNVYLSRG